MCGSLPYLKLAQPLPAWLGKSRARARISSDSPFEDQRSAAEANPESARLRECRQSGVPWKKWGPYLSERQWGTVREDYSRDGNAWDYFSHDQARSRAYRVRAWTFPITRFSLSPRNDATTGIGSH
jgi:hypothetical protein